MLSLKVPFPFGFWPSNQINNVENSGTKVSQHTYLILWILFINRFEYFLRSTLIQNDMDEIDKIPTWMTKVRLDTYFRDHKIPTWIFAIDGF